MPTVEDLGRKIKAKYPGKYDDMSDAEVGRRVKTKYPGAYDDFVETGLSVWESPAFVPTPVSASLSHHQQKFEHLTQDLIRYYNPRQGRLSAWWNRGRAEARIKLLRALNEEQMLVLEQAAMAEEAAMRSERNRKEFEKFIANHVVELMELRLSASIIDHALALGVDTDTAIYINKVKALDEYELYKLERESYIRTREYREKREIDNEFRAKEYEQDHGNITRIQQEPLELVDRETDRLFAMYERRKELEASDDPAKDDKLRMLNHNISVAEKLLYGREAGHLQASSGQEEEGNISASDEPRHNQHQERTATQPKRGPGRPRGSRNRPPNEQG